MRRFVGLGLISTGGLYCYVNKRESSSYCESRKTSVYSWGSGINGSLANGTFTDLGKPSKIASFENKNIKALSSFGNSSIASSATDIFTWGKIWNGNDVSNVATPNVIEGIKGASNISCGEFHFAAIVNGELYTWGKGSYGQFGRENNKINYPSVVDKKHFENKKLIRVSCGRQHTAALTEDGKIYTFGYGFDGQLGHGDKNDQKLPKRIDALNEEKIIDVACGRDFTICLTDKGDVYSMGSDDFGQLGQGKTIRHQREPNIVKSLSGLESRIISIAAGEFHSLALNGKGEVYGFGCNKDSQLGLGERVGDLAHAKKIESLAGKRIIQIEAGGGHSGFLDDNGTIYLCGRGRNGQIGRGDHLESVATNTHIPVEVDYFNNKGKVVQISCGSDFTLALVEN